MLHIFNRSFGGFVLTLSAAGLLSSCAGTISRKPTIMIFNDMRVQLKPYTQGESSFGGFSDGRGDRRPVPGTIARGAIRTEGNPFFSGQVNGIYLADNPLKLTRETLELGQQRFNTYCSPCHGRA